MKLRFLVLFEQHLYFGYHLFGKTNMVSCQKAGQTLTWKHSKRWSSCSGEKSQANFAKRSCTFLTMASCWPTWAAQMSSRSWRLSDFSFMMNRITFSSFSTYWGWWRESCKTIWKKPYTQIVKFTNLGIFTAAKFWYFWKVNLINKSSVWPCSCHYIRNRNDIVNLVL